MALVQTHTWSAYDCVDCVMGRPGGTIGSSSGETATAQRGPEGRAAGRQAGQQQVESAGS